MSSLSLPGPYSRRTSSWYFCGWCESTREEEFVDLPTLASPLLLSPEDPFPLATIALHVLVLSLAIT